MTTFTSERYIAAKEELARFDKLFSGASTGVLFKAAAGSEIPSHDRHHPGLAQLKMGESIGEKLRLAREARGIALRDISEQTRISMRYLEAIELDDYRRLPGGIFNRSFIRAYAKYIGYDEKDAIEEYARTMREHGELSDEVSTKPQVSLVYTDEGGSHSRSPLVTLLLAVVILVILSFCVWVGLYFYQRSVAPKMPPPQRTNQRLAPASLPTAMRIRHSTRPIQTGSLKNLTVKEGEHTSAA